MQYRIRSYNSVKSTNIEVKRCIAAGNPEGYVMQGFEQTGGYGRQGRVWSSPFGGLYFSVLLRPNLVTRDLPTLSLLTGLVLRRVLSSYLDFEQRDFLQIKWPNDVVWTGDQPGGRRGDQLSDQPGDQLDEQLGAGYFRKACGISLEAHSGGVCLGIGVNVFHPTQEVPVGGKNVPVYLCDLLRSGLAESELPKRVGEDGLTGDQKNLITRVFNDILDEFKYAYEDWCANGIEPILEEYASCCCLTGQQVSMCNLEGAVLESGTVVGIDAKGCLLLQTEAGVVSVNSGEAHLL